MGWRSGHSSIQTAFPSSLPRKTRRHLPLSRTQSEKPNICSNSTISPVGARNVRLFSRWHDQSYKCIPVACQYGIMRKNGQDPNMWECLTKLLSKFKICALFPCSRWSFLGGPFPFSCWLLDCSSCHLKHFLCSSSTFYQPWGHKTAVYVSMKFD